MSDFSTFYEAGARLAEGIDPYSALSTAAWLHCIDQCSITNGFLSPPFVAQLLVPISKVNYVVACAAWALLGIAFMVAGGWCMCRVRSPQGRLTLLGAALIVANPVTVWGLLLGQFDALEFACCMGAWLALERKRGVWAGLLLAGAAIKPQIAGPFVLFVLLVYRQQWLPLVTGLAASFGALILIEVLTVPGLVGPFFHANGLMGGTLLSKQPDLVSVVQLFKFVQFNHSLSDAVVVGLTAFGIVCCLIAYWLLRGAAKSQEGRFWLISVLTFAWVLLTPYDHSNDMVLMLPLLTWGVFYLRAHEWTGAWLIVAVALPILTALYVQASGEDSVALGLIDLAVLWGVWWALVERGRHELAGGAPVIAGSVGGNAVVDRADGLGQSSGDI
jgi:hypothetical protein